MKHFPDYQGRVWKWDFAPSGDKSSTRKGWRLYAYVPDPKAPEPIPARAFLCYDKSDAPKGDYAKYLAGILKKFLSTIVVVAATEDRFRRQPLTDGTIVCTCYTCFEQVIVATEEEAATLDSTHNCPK